MGVNGVGALRVRSRSAVRGESGGTGLSRETADGRPVVVVALSGGGKYPEDE
jgi:hypothetical protein